VLKWIGTILSLIITLSIVSGSLFFPADRVYAQNANDGEPTPERHPPILSGGSVAPYSGNTTDVYQFSVTYTDLENDKPAFVTVAIDTNPAVNMTVKAGEDNDFTNGEIYEYSTTGTLISGNYTLVSGNHTFQFAANDGVLNAIGDIEPHVGPVVSIPPVIYPPDTGGGNNTGGGTGDNSDRIYLIDYMTETPGVFSSQFSTKAYDGLLRLTFPKGTTTQTVEGWALSYITITPVTKEKQEFPVPEGGNIVGLTYKLEPDGVTFSPAIILTILYREDQIPAGINEKDLIITFWDDSEKKWVALEGCVVDSEKNTITAYMHHFSVYTILGYAPEPIPAKFSLSDLIVSPSEALPDQEIKITTTVTNTGGSAGVCHLQLKINRIQEDNQDVSLEPGASQTVVFLVNKNEVGDYLADINGKGGSFWIREPLETSYPTPERSIHPSGSPSNPSPTAAPSSSPDEPKSPLTVPWVLSAIVVGIVMIIVILLLRQKSN